jgi:hypothetical protein
MQARHEERGRVVRLRPSIRVARVAVGACLAFAAYAFVGDLIPTIVVDRHVSATQPVAPVQTVSARLPLTADATEHWVNSGARSEFRCRPDAAERWQVPNVAVADLPYSADAAEHWLTPELAVADLPYSADAAEHWLCAP